MESIHDNYYKILVGALVKARIDARLTQAELAKRWGRSQSILAKIETLERRIDLIEYLTLADILNLDVISIIDQVRTAMRVD